MESNKKRIRKDFAPLTVMTSLSCITPSSPVTQVYNSNISEWEPDRTLTPTVVHPDVVAHAKDGSWTTPQANAYLASMVWKINGVDISTLVEWQGLYSIDTVGASRGNITLSKNLAPGSYLELSFEAVFADPRLGVNIPVKCEPIILSTVDKSQDDYSISIGDDQIIQYNPFKDKLHLYEYKVAHGLATASSEARTAAIDENCYERVIDIQLYKGADIVSVDEYTVKLYQITGITSGNEQLTEMSAGSGEVLSITPGSVMLDLRLVGKRDYLIRAFVGNDAVAEKQFSVNRVYPRFTVRPTNGASILPSDKERYDVAMVDCDGNTVECPGSIIRLLWKTDTAAISGVLQGEGEEIVFPLSATGIGNTWQDDWLDVYCEGEQKGVYDIATDDDDEIFTDENDEIFIFN